MVRYGLCVVAAFIGMIAIAGSARAEERPLSGSALYRDVVRYADFAEHQTGSPGDVATSRWLAEELEKVGYRTQLQDWQFRRFVPKSHWLNVAGRRIEAYPFWFPKTTNGTLKATLGQLTDESEPGSLRGKIAFLPGKRVGRKPHFAGIHAEAERAQQAGAIALVVVVPIPSGELMAVNARQPFVEQALPLPCLIVSSRDEDVLLHAESEGHDVAFFLDGDEEPSATAYNVIARLERGPKWIVVTTPSSGWFRCAGERGPGVALFLGLARWAATHESPYSFLFIANSGHELDNLGAHHSIDASAPPPEEVACWIHLGASIATREWEETEAGARVLDSPNRTGHLVGTSDLLPHLKAAFQPVDWIRPRSGGMVAGELRHFMNAGYRCFGFFGAHHYFHTQLDTPETTAPEYLEPIGSGLVEMIRLLEQDE